MNLFCYEFVTSDIVPLENHEVSERTGIILPSYFSPDAHFFSRQPLPLCLRSFSRMLTYNWGTWLCARKSASSSVLPEDARR